MDRRCAGQVGSRSRIEKHWFKQSIKRANCTTRNTCRPHVPGSSITANKKVPGSQLFNTPRYKCLDGTKMDYDLSAYMYLLISSPIIFSVQWKKPQKNWPCFPILLVRRSVHHEVNSLSMLTYTSSSSLHANINQWGEKCLKSVLFFFAEFHVFFMRSFKPYHLLSLVSSA